MKRVLCSVLTIAIILSGVSAIVVYYGDATKKKYQDQCIDKMWDECTRIKGDINNRVVVTSSKKLEELGAVASASGYDDTYIFQYATKTEADRAFDYYSQLDYVDGVYFDSIMHTDFYEASTDIVPNCYATSNSNIDDQLKLVATECNSLREVKVGVIDSDYCQINDFTESRIVNGSNDIDSSNMHGTLVCSTIINNTFDNVKVYSYGAGSEDDVSVSLAAMAINKAVKDGCSVINMSFSTTADIALPTFEKACLNAYLNDVLLVSSAGNDGKDLDIYKKYPACYLFVTAVGNLTESRSLNITSNYGSNVRYTTGTNVRGYFNNSPYYWSGTSASAPVYCAIVANMLSVRYLSIGEINSYLLPIDGIPTNESNKKRFITDGYSAVCAMLNTELEKTDIKYAVSRNDDTQLCEVTFTSDDDSKIYYVPGNCYYCVDGQSRTYMAGDSVPVNITTKISATAYAPGKAKSDMVIFKGLDNSDTGFTTSGSKLTTCTMIDNKIIKVPEYINGEKITSVSDYCFAGNPNVEKIILPDSVKTIGMYAFASCPKLEKVTANKATSIGRFAFFNCRSLTQLIAPKLNVSSYTGLFYNCSNLRMITRIGDGTISTLHKYCGAFKNCDNLLNYFNLNGVYTIDSISENKCKYTSPANSESLIVDLSELRYLWDEYYINYKTTNYQTDSSFLFDLNNDGIINAKDYKIICSGADEFVVD